ncbi:amidohydrolase family protein [Variovorax sp. YR216]|uniref:amidohydrolase family protein n=1 Tax=Variovorax sp. YR216 TaxID=1882828 RepID=UPI000899E6BE|nr:amidohydrolase family protein [Variovorax sp. YR216]SEB23524.1 Cytosine/adenosine deaminase [Variovorax sp. YR216]
MRRDSELIIRGGYVLTMDPVLGDMPCADVLVRDGQIAWIGPDIEAKGAREVDARGMIVMPGFVDTHWHLWNSSLRALVRGDDAVRGYFPVTLGIGPLFTPEDSYRSVRLGLAEGIASGITTVNNWSHNTRSAAHADAEIRAMDDMGVRGRFSYGWGQESPLDRPMDLDDLARVQRNGLPESGLLTLGAAVRTPVSNPRGVVPIEVVAAEIDGIRRLGLPVTMHARPGVVSVLDQHGLLGRDLQLVHPQGISADECVRLAESGTSMTCSPVIEVHYAQATRGEIQFQELLDAKVQQSLSVDSSAASANADFFSCMRALLWSHKQRFGANVALSPKRLLELATIDGARDLGIADRVGSLVTGKRADIILVRTGDPNMAPVVDPAYSLVYSAQPANVDTVMVDGRILRRHGRFIACDHEQIVHEARESVRGLASRAPQHLCTDVCCC